MNRRDFLRNASGISCTLLAASATHVAESRPTNGAAYVGIAEPFADVEARFPHFLSAPVSYLNVLMQDRIWSARQQTVHDVSVPWATRHYDAAGGLEALKKNPTRYSANTQPGDMEAVKFIEAMASTVGVCRDPAIESLIDAWVKRLTDAQTPDGYLASVYPLGADPGGRWQAVWYSHEDYALGHYLESAIAYKESTGNDFMYRSALRAVDNMATALRGRNSSYAPGHPEIEQALMRLYGVTGETHYLELCGWLISQRGQHEGRRSFGKYAQDHLPVKQQRTIEGHAVRAAFLFNGVTEYVGATGDPEYRAAVLAIWDDFAKHKMYIHGAGGIQSAGNEGYSSKPDFIPPGDCFGESCSVFGNFQWAHSLFRLTGSARYLDTAERMLYNSFLGSLSMHGDRFFYRNLVESPEPTFRSEWHPVPCCPPNIVKLFSKIGGFFYSTDSRGIYVKHYGASEVRLPSRSPIKITQRTDFPWSGEIGLQVTVAHPTTFALRLRIPDWAKSHTVTLNGAVVANVELEQGWWVIEREWKGSETVKLSLSMEVERLVMPSEFREYAGGLVAFRRGPLIYCLEEQDMHPSYVYRSVPENAVFIAEHRADLLGGITVLKGTAQQFSWTNAEMSVPVTLIPYGFWNNRGPDSMRIWLPTRKLSLVDLPRDPPNNGAA